MEQTGRKKQRQREGEREGEIDEVCAWMGKEAEGLRKRIRMRMRMWIWMWMWMWNPLTLRLGVCPSAIDVCVADAGAWQCLGRAH